MHEGEGLIEHSNVDAILRHEGDPKGDLSHGSAFREEQVLGVERSWHPFAGSTLRCSVREGCPLPCDLTRMFSLMIYISLQLSIGAKLALRKLAKEAVQRAEARDKQGPDRT